VSLLDPGELGLRLSVRLSGFFHRA
jgi:hypothetical protein